MTITRAEIKVVSEQLFQNAASDILVNFPTDGDGDAIGTAYLDSKNVAESVDQVGLQPSSALNLYRVFALSIRDDRNQGDERLWEYLRNYVNYEPGSRKTYLEDVAARYAFVFAPIDAAILAGYPFTAAAVTGEVFIEAPSQVLEWGNSNLGSSTTTRYLGPGIQTGLADTVIWSREVKVAGRVRSSVRQEPGPPGKTMTYTIVINGTPSAAVVVMQSDDTSAVDDVNFPEVVPGDLVASRVTRSASGATARNVINTLEIF